MPLTRDLVSLALLVVVVLVIMLAHLQWKRMRSGIPALLDSGAFKADGASLVALGERVRKANTWFGRFGKYWWIFMLVASVVMVLIMRYIQGEGLLALPGTTKLVRAAIAKTLYDGWWAGIAWHSFPGAIAYFLIGTIGLYVILVQIAVGLVVFRLVLGLGTDSLIEVSIDRYNRDGLAGWRAVSNVLNTVYLSFLVLAIGLSLMILANGSDYVVIPGLVVLWLILVPVFIVVPLWTFGAQMSRSKQVVIDEYVERATVESAAADDGWSAATDAVVRDGAASLQNLPSLPLNLPQGLISVVAALLPLAAALYKAGV